MLSRGSRHDHEQLARGCVL